MKNAMQLKAIIKNLAKEKHISAQLVMQNFMLERLLERIVKLCKDGGRIIKRILNMQRILHLRMCVMWW